MEGRGVTNYDLDKPSYAFSTSTTEFDDALIQRGIVNFEQAMMAKGASAEEARRLADLKRQQEAPDVNAAEKDSDDDDEESDDDDEFLKRYRQERLRELQKQQQRGGQFGEVIPISRPEWKRQVNEDSMNAWVVVILTSHDVERTGCVEKAVGELAHKFQSVKFVTIPSGAAIDNFPNDNLPTIFLYRNGKLQKELVRMNRHITTEELEWELSACTVLETTLEGPPSQRDESSRSLLRGYGGTFGGTIAQLQTRRYESDEDSDDF